MNADPNDLVPIARAPALFASRPCVQTIRNWINDGIKGRRLRAVRIGVKIYISRGAAADFILRMDGGRVGAR